MEYPWGSKLPKPGIMRGLYLKPKAGIIGVLGGLGYVTTSTLGKLTQVALLLNAAMPGGAGGVTGLSGSRKG